MNHGDEGGDEDMEVYITTQQDDESIRTKSDQFMEEQSEPDFEQVFNHGPLPIHETFAPTKQANNPLSIGTKSVQLVYPNMLSQFRFNLFIFLQIINSLCPT